MECVKVIVGVRKPKKKQVKDEFDRIKQAEKKRRRLEKALATSAAIRSELEKKKLKKKEEQERLDGEGAAIAEAVALQVLLGEDSDDSKKKDQALTSWNHARSIDFVVGPTHNCYNLEKYSCRHVSGIPGDNQYGRMWNFCGNSNLMASSDNLCSSFYPQYFGQGVRGSVGLSPGHLAAQPVERVNMGTVIHCLVKLPYFRSFCCPLNNMHMGLSSPICLVGYQAGNTFTNVGAYVFVKVSASFILIIFSHLISLPSRFLNELL